MSFRADVLCGVVRRPSKAVSDDSVAMYTYLAAESKRNRIVGRTLQVCGFWAKLKRQLAADVHFLQAS